MTEKNENVSPDYNPENILSDINRHILRLDFQNDENYKFVFNFSSDLPYPFWVNGNSIKSVTHSNRFLKPVEKKMRIVSDGVRKDVKYTNKIFSFPAFPIFVKLGKVAKLVINSYKKKVSSLMRMTRRYPAVTDKQLLVLTSLLVSLLMLAFF